MFSTSKIKSFYHFISILLLIDISYIHAEKTINHNQLWLDDFNHDPLGQAGWNIHQMSGYPLTNPNPVVVIDNKPEYHGPFPSKYSLKRYISCNTVNQTRLYVSMLASYCNTDRKNDLIQFRLVDPTATYTMDTWSAYRLNQKDTLLNRYDLTYVQSATAIYYTNHTSSSTITPQCSQPVSNSEPITTHLTPGEWYRTSKHMTYDSIIMGGHTYEIVIEMVTNAMDEYVVVSDILAQCVQLYFPTPMPSTNPTVRPTTSNPTVVTDMPSETPTYVPTIGTDMPTETPSRTPTQTPTIETLVPSASPTSQTLGPSSSPTFQTTSPTSQTLGPTSQTPGPTSQTQAPILTLSNTISHSQESFEDQLRDDASDDPWCPHCALFVVIICIALVLCFLGVMFFACVKHRKEAQRLKSKHLKSHMNKYKARVIPKYSHHNDNGSEDEDKYNDNNISNSAEHNNYIHKNHLDDQNYEHTESTKFTGNTMDELNENIQQQNNENEVEIDVESDVNIMRYDEMDPSDQKHSIHKQSMLYTSAHTQTVTEDFNIDDDDDVLGINPLNNNNNNNEHVDEFDEYDYVNDEFNESNITQRQTELRIVDNASYDHLNMDETDLVDKSDSPYF